MLTNIKIIKKVIQLIHDFTDSISKFSDAVPMFTCATAVVNVLILFPWVYFDKNILYLEEEEEQILDLIFYQNVFSTA